MNFTSVALWSPPTINSPPTLAVPSLLVFTPFAILAIVYKRVFMQAYKQVYNQVYKTDCGKKNKHLVPTAIKTKVFEPDACDELLKGNVFDGNGNVVQNQLSFLEARALANERLLHVFNIDNSFTTSDEDRHRAFKEQADAHIDKQTIDWTLLANAAQQHISNALNCVSNGEELHLMSLVQELTLRVALNFLFDINPPSHDDHHLAAVAKEINELWIDAKGNTLHEYNRFTQNYEFMYHLAALLPGFVLQDPQRNPLNVIIPAYESVWRIALLGFLECRRAMERGSLGPHSGTFDCKRALSDFLRQQKHSKDEEKQEKDAIRPGLNIAKEALRIYPSTRRVFRKFQADERVFKQALDVWAEPEARDGKDVFECAADIETCQRKTWADGKKFDPKRHEGSKPGNGYLKPFGTGNYKCPAAARFGYRLVALLIATLTVSIEGDRSDEEASDYWWQFEPSCIMESSGPFPSGRKDFRAWRLVKMGPSVQSMAMSSYNLSQKAVEDVRRLEQQALSAIVKLHSIVG